MQKIEDQKSKTLSEKFCTDQTNTQTDRLTDLQTENISIL